MNADKINNLVITTKLHLHNDRQWVTPHLISDSFMGTHCILRPMETTSHPSITTTRLSRQISTRKWMLIKKTLVIATKLHLNNDRPYLISVIYGNSLYTKTDWNNIVPLYSDHSIFETNPVLTTWLLMLIIQPCYYDQPTSVQRPTSGYTPSSHFRVIYGNSLYTKTDWNDIAPLYSDHSTIEANPVLTKHPPKRLLMLMIIRPCNCDQPTSA